MSSKTERQTKYRQPLRDYIGRTMKGHAEIVDFVPQSHLRIWNNVQEEGYDTHYHNAAEIILCVDNLYSVSVGNMSFNLNAGDILFIPPNMLHSIQGGRGERFIYLIDLSPLRLFIDFNFIEPSIMNPLLLNRQNYEKLYDKVKPRLMTILDIYFKAQNMWELMIYSELFRVYAEIGTYHFDRNEMLPEDAHSQIYYEKFANLLHYIDTHYDEELNLDWAADHTGFSKYHFLRLFKEYTDMTYYDYVIHKRIQAAQSLLSTDESVTNIAIRTGFNNLASFSRCFKQHTGLSPSQYRSKKEQLDHHGMSKQIIPLPASGEGVHPGKAGRAL